MVPSPDNDTPPKAPDKNNKTNLDTNNKTMTTKGSNPKRDQALSELDERQLRDLLDEAVNYKNPNDREGKSLIFNQLLSEAEEGLRNERATQAGGSELVRYCNQQAKRNARHHNNNNNNNYNSNNNNNQHQYHHQQHHHQHHRKSSTSSSIMTTTTTTSSVTKNNVHGGSLNNLTKDELYDISSKHRTKKSVSARQREGGSLPCNVNTGITSTTMEFLEEARRNKKQLNEKTIIVNDLSESERLLEHDSLANDYQEEDEQQQQQIPLTEITHYPINQPAKFTSRATLQVNNVDDPLQLTHLESNNVEKKKFLSIPNTLTTTSSTITTTPITITTTATTTTTTSSVISTNTSTMAAATTNRLLEDGKKVDENGNALQQQQQPQQQNSSTLKTKRKKTSDKNVIVRNSESVEGHRGDIINDVDKLVEYIGDSKNDHPKNRSNIKSKQFNRHNTITGSGNITTTTITGTRTTLDDNHINTNKSTTKKQQQQQRAHSSKSKDNRNKLKKSNSLGEISTTSLEDFSFNNKDNKVELRNSNNNNNNNKNSDGSGDDNNNNTSNKNKERRSWGNMDVINSVVVGGGNNNNNNINNNKIDDMIDNNNIKSIQLQNLYNTASIENLESAEFRVVTKKKKSKKRRNSLNSRLKSSTSQQQTCINTTTTVTTTPTTSTPTTINKNHNKTMKTTEFNRRKSACSVPPSEKSNDSSDDVDSVHSLPIDTQKCIDLVVNNNNNNNIDDGNNINNLPISYADRLKCGGGNENYTITSATIPTSITPNNSNNNNNCKKVINEKVPKLEYSTTPPSSLTTTTTIMNDLNSNNIKIVNQSPPDVHNIKNFPAITKQNLSTLTTITQQQAITTFVDKINKNNCNNKNKVITTNNIKKNLKNTPIEQIQNTDGISIVDNLEIQYSANLPPNIQTVQTIEKMQLIGSGHPYDDNTGAPPIPNNHHQQQQHHSNKQQFNKNTTATINHNNNNNNSNNDNSKTLSSISSSLSSTSTKSSSSSSSSSASSSSSKTNDDCSLDCDSNNERTISVDNINNNNNSNNNNNNNHHRPPPVVILSGLGSSQKEAVRGLVFGFDINEQLLSEDDNSVINNNNNNNNIDDSVDNTTTTKIFNCDDFIAKYRPPETYTTTSHNHDKILNYIGSAWEDVLMNVSNGNVLYYSELQ